MKMVMAITMVKEDFKELYTDWMHFKNYGFPRF